MEFLIVLVVLTIVVFVVTGPLRRAARVPSGPAGPAPDSEAAAQMHERELAELEAAREAKYREIRDAELDHDTGKLSDADFEAIDRTLRTEAIEILKAIDRERGASEEQPSD